MWLPDCLLDFVISFLQEQQGRMHIEVIFKFFVIHGRCFSQITSE